MVGLPTSLKKATPAVVQAFVETNAAVLVRLRRSLLLTSAVPWIPTEAYLTSHAQDLGPIKSAGYLLIAAGMAEEFQGRPAAARDSFLEALRYAGLAASEGVVIDQLVAESVGGLALESLAALVPRLDRADRVRLLQEIQAWNDAIDPPATVASRERALIAAAYGRWARARFWVAETVLRFGGRKTGSGAALQALNSALARRLLKSTAVAAAAFSAEHQRLPVRWEELCPTWVSAPAMDPFTGQPLRFKRAGDRLLIYSLGPDQQDQGGVPFNATTPQTPGDIVIEIPAPK
jgi:hypothetical protein